MSKKIVLALCALFLITATPALADDGDRRGRGDHWQGRYDDDDRRRVQAVHGKQDKHKKYYKVKRDSHRVTWHGKRRWSPPAGHYHGRHFHQHRHVPGHVQGRGLGHYKGRGLGHIKHGSVYKHRYDRNRVRRDDWALYAILALQIVDVLNESQRDSFAWAQQRAVSAPLGETIHWSDGGASGSVVPIRDGSDTAGRYCREFQKEVVIGNRRQSGYGVACRQPDGDWEIVS